MREKHRADWTVCSLLETAETLLQDQYGKKKMLGVNLLGVPYNKKIIQDDPHVIQTIGRFIESYVND